MASYDAVVNLNVVGTSRLNRVASAVGELNNLTQDLNKSFNLLKPGAGELGDKLRVAFEPIKKFARDATNGVAQFSNTLKGATQQAQVFKTVLENVNIKKGGFDQQEAVVKDLANAWAEATIRVSEYNRRLKELQETALANRGLMMLSSGEIAAGTEAGVGVQGPRLPTALGGGLNLPEGVPRLAAPGLRGLQGAVSKPGTADAIIGAGFPALFGGGPGAILGGGLGGLAGGAMGGSLGMALSIGLSAVGQKLDQIFGAAIQKTAELGSALSKLDVQALRESTINVTAELDTQVRLLVEAGKYDQARAVIAKEIANQTGSLGSGIQDSARATKQLSAAWNAVSGTVNTLLAVFTVELQTALAGVLQLVNLVLKGINLVVSGARELGKIFNTYLPILNPLGAFFQQLANLLPQNTEEQQKLAAAAEAASDASVRDLQLKKQLLDVDRARVEGSNRIAQQSQIDAAFTRDKLTAEKELADEIRRINLEGAQLTEGQRALEIAIAQAKAEQKIDEAAITKEKGQQRLLNDAIIAGLQDQANAQQVQADQYTKALSSTAAILQIEQQRLQQRLQFTTSLNQESSLINGIAANRKKLADVEYQAAVTSANSAVQQAAAEYDIVQAKYEQNNADIEQVNAAQRKLQTAIQARGVDIEVAGLKRQQAMETAELERRQAQVNAYAEEYARINERVTRQLEEQTNALSNRASLTAAISQAVQTINNLEIEGLTRELERTSSTERRAQIIDRIYKLEVENARVALEATRAQIQAELARAEAAYRTVQLKYEELRAVVQIAEAEGVVNRAHYAALEAQGSALRIAKDNLATAGQIAQWQWKAADAVFKAAVDAAKLKKEMGGAASAAGEFAGNMERAAAASQKVSGIGQQTTGEPFAAYGGAMAIEDPVLRKVAMDIWERASADAARMARSGASIGVPGLPNAERQIAEIALAERKMREEEQKRAEQQKIQNLITSGELSKYPFEIAQQIRALVDRSVAAELGKTPDMGYAQLSSVAAAKVAAPASPTPITTTAPITMGLSLQPGGGPGMAIIDSFPKVPTTINLQTGPVLQQEDGKKYVTLSDLEKILQDFAAVVFNNARTAGGRQYQGVN